MAVLVRCRWCGNPVVRDDGYCFECDEQLKPEDIVEEDSDLYYDDDDDYDLDDDWSDE